jgi:hypothetical protein
MRDMLEIEDMMFAIQPIHLQKDYNFIFTPIKIFCIKLRLSMIVPSLTYSMMKNKNIKC